METAAGSAPACEIARLPEELLSAALALTTPRDACRAAAVSRDFHAAADSDAVWSRFLPRDLPPLADGELSGPAPPSDKGRFLRLRDRPILLADGLIFSESAELLYVWWLEIRGKIDSKMLSQNTTCAAYFVFTVARNAYGLGSPPYPETSVSLGESKSTRQVCLDVYDRGADDTWPAVWLPVRSDLHEIPQNVLLPRERDDFWMELEMGEFRNDGGEDGEVSFRLLETSATVKCGLVVQGIEVRPKKQEH